MKLVKQTDEYIVYLKRSGRYGVKNTDREWINGVSKIRILLAEGLVETTLPPEPEADADEVVDDAGGSTDNDIAAAEEDLSTDHTSDSSDSETEEPVLDEPADPKEESSSATEVDDSVPEETINDSDEEDPETSDSSDSETEEPVLDEPADPKEESSSATEVDDSVPEETINDSDEEDPETSTASNSSDDVANADTTDEEEPEALEDPEGKEP